MLLALAAVLVVRVYSVLLVGDAVVEVVGVFQAATALHCKTLCCVTAAQRAAGLQ
jgi:hypothetical protein